MSWLSKQTQTLLNSGKLGKSNLNNSSSSNPLSSYFVNKPYHPTTGIPLSSYQFSTINYGIGSCTLSREAIKLNIPDCSFFRKFKFNPGEAVVALDGVPVEFRTFWNRFNEKRLEIFNKLREREINNSLDCPDGQVCINGYCQPATTTTVYTGTSSTTTGSTTLVNVQPGQYVSGVWYPGGGISTGTTTTGYSYIIENEEVNVDLSLEGVCEIKFSFDIKELGYLNSIEKFYRFLDYICGIVETIQMDRLDRELRDGDGFFRLGAGLINSFICNEEKFNRDKRNVNNWLRVKVDGGKLIGK